ncbi:MAG: hypothetical protein KBT20_04015 [Bacteroidales bacterium]|nr:hypothetical protein [Candidatus Liminaster caballi]
MCQVMVFIEKGLLQIFALRPPAWFNGLNDARKLFVQSSLGFCPVSAPLSDDQI